MNRIYTISLSNSNQLILVDLEDYLEYAKYSWNLTKDEYVQRTFNGTTIRLHREIMQLKKGDHLDVDHVDGNSLNNCRSNLRICSRSKNLMNAKPQIGRSSKYKGVRWRKDCCKWTAQIMLEGKLKHLGYFSKEIEAAKIYDEAAQRLFKEFANTNFSIPLKAPTDAFCESNK